MEWRLDLLGFSTINMRRLCKKHARNRNMEHIPNITVMGNASTFKDKQTTVNSMLSTLTGSMQFKGTVVYCKYSYKHTLYSTMQTNILSGIRKKFMMVLLASSGMYWDLIFIIDGQNSPTQASKAQNPRSWIQPANEMLPPFVPEGATKNCFKTSEVREQQRIKKYLRPLKSYNMTYTGHNGK